MRDSPEFDEWLAQARERTHRSAVTVAAHLALAATADAPGEESLRGEAAISAARRWVELDPLDEEAHRCLMGLLARASRRAAAFAQYEACRQLLARELGVEPEPATRMLLERLRGAGPSGASGAAPDPATRVEAPQPPHNLPYPVTSFIGRERELANLSRLLGTAGVRLVTLVGAGGMGKTRLALEVARAILPRYAGGVWLVDLAALPPESVPEGDATDGLPVARAVAGALGVLESAPDAGRGTLAETVAGALRGREVLLLLDNCEHVPRGVASLVTVLLDRCPELTVLATSREPLHLPSEVLYDLAPLMVPALAAAGAPDKAPATPEQALEYSAVRLLVERAAAIQRGYELTGADLGPALEVCRVLDGMPLAIELAAAQLHALSLAELAQALGAWRQVDSETAAMARSGEPWRLVGDGNRGALPRQQTLRNTIAWSYELLERRERLLFDRLSVFAGSFGLDGAESVAGCDGLAPREVGRLLAELVDRSLVVRLAHPGAPRYRLLETLRAFAQERLDERCETALAIRRHTAHYMGLVEYVEPAVLAQGREALDAYRLLDAEADNLAAAVRRALADGRNEDALRIGGAAQLWALQRPWFAQYGEWMRTALESRATTAPLYRAKGWDTLACWAANWGMIDAMEHAALETLACARAAGDLRWKGHGLFRLGFALRAQGREGEALEALREAAEIGRQTGDGNMEICCRLALADAAAPARACAELEPLVSVSPVACRPYALQFLAGAAMSLGDLPAVEAAVRESRAGWDAQGNRAMVAALSSWLAELLALRGAYSEAMALHERALDEIVRFRGAWFRPDYMRRLARLVWQQGDIARASELLREALESAETQGHADQAMLAKLDLAVLAAESGQPDAARALLAEGGAAETPPGEGTDPVLAARGRVAFLTGDHAAAIGDYGEMLARARSAESRPDVAQASEHLAWALAAAGEPDEAAALLAEAEAERAAMGMVLYPVDVPHRERALALVAGRAP